MSGYALAIGRVPAIGALPRGRRGHGLVLAMVALVAVAGLELARPLVSAGPGPSSAPAATAPAEASWPDGLRAAAEAAISADAYRFAANPDGTWAASTPAHGLRSLFGPAGPTVESRAGDWALELSLARMGRPGELAPVAPAEVVGSGDLVEYRRGDLVEWYRNEARGLEQGFDLATAPGGTGPLVIELDASGLALALSADGTEVLAGPPGAGTVLRYNGLQATDATGRRLPAWLAVEGQALRLFVDDAGAAYPVAIDPWFQQAKLTASDADAAAADDQFGVSVAVSGDTAVVGANGDDSPSLANAGSAYVFVRSGGSWAQQAKLTASDAAAADNFGYSVAVSGDTAVVGAYIDDRPSLSNAGSAYVFVRSGGTWAQQANLTASDAAGSDFFGYSVAVSGDTAVVGAYGDDRPSLGNAGSAYVFVRSGVTWAEQGKLTAAADAAADDFFGWSVAVSGDTAVVGAYGDDRPSLGNAGSAYVFVRSGVTWAEQGKLTAADAAAFDLFGVSVALSGDTAVVGAYLDDSPPLADAGSAYVFVRSGGTWAQQAKLTASDAAAGDAFGVSVAVSGDTAVVGANGDDSPPLGNAGSAYVFVRSGGTWAQQAKLTASDAAAGDQFGWSVAVSGDTAVVGAYLDDSPAATNAGSAYVFVLPPESSVWVANFSANSLTRYPPTASGNAAPTATISGGATGLGGPVGVVVDGSGRLYVANQSANTITEFAPGATGNTAPLATIGGGATQLSGPRALALDGAGKLYVTNGGDNSVTVYAPGATGNVAPLARIAGAATGLNVPFGVVVDAAGLIYVANFTTSTVTRYPAGATANQAPDLTITAGVSAPETMVIDAAGALYVTNSANNTVTKYVNGALVATISGGGLSVPVGIALDATGRLAVTNFSANSLTYFSPGGHLLRTISGPATGLNGPVGIAAVPIVTVTTSSPLPTAVVGVAYNQALAATGGTGPYTWALATGSLPPGVSLSSVGVVSGTPTARGTFAFNVTVTDSAGHTTTYALSLRSRETTAPVCVWSRQAGPPRRVDFAVSDAGSGLASIAVTTAVNMKPVDIPPFSPGTKLTVNFWAVKDNQSLPAQVAVVLTDVDGNQSSCT